MTTKQQAKLIEFLIEHEKHHAHGPTFEEMRHALGVAKSRVHYLVKGLLERGLIEQVPFRARAVRLKKQPTEIETIQYCISLIEGRSDCLKATNILKVYLTKKELQKGLTLPK